MRRLSTTPRLTRVYVSSKSDLNSPSYVDFSAGSGVDWGTKTKCQQDCGAVETQKMANNIISALSETAITDFGWGFEVK